VSLQVLYTPRSKETLKSVYDFIYNKFGSRSVDKFITKAEKIIALIAEHPLIFKASVIDKNVRVGLISKQTSLFYRITDTTIHLLFFWDNRQEPILSR
jgi:plasmid stabilization system protein ParE